MIIICKFCDWEHIQEGVLSREKPGFGYILVVVGRNPLKPWDPGIVGIHGEFEAKGKTFLFGQQDSSTQELQSMIEIKIYLAAALVLGCFGASNPVMVSG